MAKYPIELQDTKREARLETGRADFRGYCALAGGIACVALGVFLLVRWYYGSVDLRESARGDRIEMPLDLSRPGVCTWKPSFTTASRPEDLNLCFCEKYGLDLLPSPAVLDGLWFDVRVKNPQGDVLAASSYRGDPTTFKPICGITLIGVRRDGAVFYAEEPIIIELEVLRGVDELKGVPAALYFVYAVNKGVGFARVFNYLLVLCPGLFFLLLKMLLLFVWVRLKPGVAKMQSPKTGDASSGADLNPFQE